jgi:glycosyltransferase involved in cell wall biosynthesis
LFVGSDEFARKGGPVLLEAWAEVERRVAGSRLVIAGPRRPIQSRAREVQWVGRVPRQDLAAYYRSASVFVLPSLFEPLGLVLLEAMGYGLPCVASNCCAMPELVADGRTGLLTPPGDAAALADALVRLLSDPDLAAALGRAGHRELVARHTWDHVGQRMARAIETRRGRDAAAPRPLSVRATRPG